MCLYLLCVGTLCILSVCLMVEEVEFCMIEGVGRIDENALAPHIQKNLLTSSFSKVESIVHLQASSNTPNLDVLQFETIET